jgi:hypothetical protein
MFSKSLISLALAASALANVFVRIRSWISCRRVDMIYLAVKITSPVASTIFTAGQQATISWQDDGTSPNLTSFGASLVGIYTGNANQQVSYQSEVNETSLIFARPYCKPLIPVLTCRPPPRSFSPPMGPLDPIVMNSKRHALSCLQPVSTFFFFSFVRFTSLVLHDAANPQFPAEAFSAKFT